MKCGTRICESEAAYRVHWPGQPICLCCPCALRATRIADAMSFPLTTEPLDPDGLPLALAVLVEKYT